MSTAYPIRLQHPGRVAQSRAPRAAVQPRPFISDKWQKTGIFLIVGYILFNRSFAYLGIPQLKLFIGEIVLFCFLVFRPNQGVDTLRSALAAPGRLHDCAWAMLIFISYGLFEMCRGLALGYSLITCLENFSFNYYALYLPLGWWLGARNPGLLKTIVMRLAWLNG